MHSDMAAVSVRRAVPAPVRNDMHSDCRLYLDSFFILFSYPIFTRALQGCAVIRFLFRLLPVHPPAV